MGRLARFRYREIVGKLKTRGFAFDRQAAGCHETGSTPLPIGTQIPNHSSDMPEGTLRVILKQAGIDPDLFIAD